MLLCVIKCYMLTECTCGPYCVHPKIRKFENRSWPRWKPGMFIMCDIVCILLLGEVQELQW